MRVCAISLAMLAACAAPRPLPREDLDVVDDAPRVIERDFTLAWRGARIGDAHEREAWDASGVTLERRERIRVRRGGAPAATDVAIAIHADRALRADRVEWHEARSDGPARDGVASRDAAGWRIAIDGEPVRRASGAAVPDELVPMLVRRDGAFRGDVLLVGRGFAVARALVVPAGPPAGPRALRETIATDAGTLAADVTLDRDGDALRVVGSDGVVAARAARDELAAAFDPPEVVDGAALALDGAPPADDDVRAPIAIELRGIVRAPPPALPGQRTIADDDAWRVELVSEQVDAGALRAIAHDVFIDTSGDCTAHALAFAARAAGAGVATRIVTGWRIDGARLVRHRWALAESGGAWIAIDPSYDEAPAAPRLIGLAVGDASASSLAAADLAFSGTEAATAILIAAP